MSLFIGVIGEVYEGFGASALEALNECGMCDNVQIMLDNGMICYGNLPNINQMSDRIIPLGEKHGLLAGRVISSFDYKPVRFDCAMLDALVGNPQLCTTHFWGRYSGCLYNKKKREHTLLRDPLGLSTLFYVVHDGAVFFSNQLRLLYQVLAYKPALNLYFFAEHAIGQNYTSGRTPFEGIYELQPGMALHVDVDGGERHELLWDLSAYNRTSSVDLNEYEQELYCIVKRCLKGWFANSSGICLHLSGGLDSSALMILLYDVFKGEKPVIGINFFDSKISSSNEIEFAQEVANACSFDLELLDWQNGDLLDPLPHEWYPDRPGRSLLGFSMVQRLAEISSTRNCSDIVSGQGGDHMFLAPHPRKALSDYWINKRIWSSKRIISELSAINRAPWWIIVREGLRDVGSYYVPSLIRSDCAYNWPNMDSSHLNEHYADVVTCEPFYLVPYLKGCPPGKFEHIRSLSHAVGFANKERFLLQHTFLYPFLFQPIVECALRIPTYQSFGEGYDRIVLRKLANNIVPARALWRHIKGETTGTTCNWLIKQISRIEEIMRDGKLVKKGLVNVQWLDNEIIKIRHGASTNLWPLLHLLSAQIWIDKWGL